MALALSPPLVSPPITRCVSGVRVLNTFEGADVFILANGNLLTPAPFRAYGPDIFVPVPTGRLNPGDSVTAIQSLGGDASEPSPEPVEVMATPTGPQDLAGVSARAPLTECATCFWIDGVCPGASVTVAAGGRPPVVIHAERTVIHVDVAGALGRNEIVTVQQRACGIDGPVVSLPPALGLDRNMWPAMPPDVEQPLLACQRTLRLNGIRPGATVVVTRDGEELRACFGSDSGRFTLSTGLRAGEPIAIRQEMTARECGLTGRTAHHHVSSAPPSAPWFPYPICAGDRVVTVAGLEIGSTVIILADNVPLCRAAAASETSRIALPSGGLAGISVIGVRQALCHNGPWSATSTRAVRPLGQTHQPKVVRPLLACGLAVGVTGLHAGTLIRIMSARHGPIGETVANGDFRVDVAVWPELSEGDHVWARTIRCGVLRDWPERSVVEPFPQNFLSRWPNLHDPAYDFGGAVAVHNLFPGARVIVEQVIGTDAPGDVLGIVVGSAVSTTTEVSVRIPRLPAGVLLRARQSMCGHESRPSRVVMLGDDERAPDYVNDSDDPGTFRICQLTGPSDPVDRPHPFDTERVDLYGTDLGIPVEHGGNLWLFFGDTIGARDVDLDSDPLAWTTDDDLGPDWRDAPGLRWWLDRNGRVQRLVVAGLPPLGNFEVPTGGFTYDGALYLFVATEKIDNRMRTSHLARAGGGIAGQVPQLLYGEISTTAPDPRRRPPAGPWMVHISPTVVHNADWPGLPSATGDGVLLFSTSLYYASNVYLSWFPIAPGLVPPPPAEWRFLADATPVGPSSWRTHSELSQMAVTEPQRLLTSQPHDRLAELSVAWLPALRRWIMTHQSDAPYPQVHYEHTSVMCRVARNPWGPWSTPARIFHRKDPTRDAANTQPNRKFVGDRWRPDPSRECITYAPYIVPRWTRWDASRRRLKLVYTLSTELNEEGWVPTGYQPQLMESPMHFP